jgi:hypothetical protein
VKHRGKWSTPKRNALPLCCKNNTEAAESNSGLLAALEVIVLSESKKATLMIEILATIGNGVLYFCLGWTVTDIVRVLWFRKNEKIEEGKM